MLVLIKCLSKIYSSVVYVLINSSQNIVTIGYININPSEQIFSETSFQIIKWQSNQVIEL